MQSPPQTFPLSLPISLSPIQKHKLVSSSSWTEAVVLCEYALRIRDICLPLLVLILWFIFVPFLGVLGQHVIDRVRQRRQFPLVDQLELLHEINKVLEARVQMGLSIKLHDLLNVVVVHMSVDSKESLQNRLYDLPKVFRKRHSVLDREDSRVVNLFLDPGHEEVD